MAKTLTDRTSVRVAAKSETDANNQKKNDANNIAKALGKDGDLDDAKASNVASKLGNTITDENGTTWAKSSEVAAAAKELDGEIGETKSYRYGNVACIPLVSLPIIRTNAWYENENYYSKGKISHGPVGVDKDGYNGYVGSDNETLLIGWVHNINDDSYTFLFSSQNSSPSFIFEDENSYFEYIEELGVTNLNNWTGSSRGPARPVGSVPVTDVGNTLLSLPAYGDLHEETSGGSKVDTSKSEAQIKDEIESKAWAQGKAAKINPIEPNETYIAVTDANGNPLYFLGT